jgi:Flp pilus assembly protein TadG
MRAQVAAPLRSGGASRRAKSSKGAELLEFTLAFLPLTAIIFVLLDLSWGIYVKSTLVYAVHQGVRQGITIDGTQAGGTTLTSLVKNIVQRNALGLLPGSDGLSRIHVDFYRASGASLTTVTQAGGGLMAGDIIQVTIQGYSLPALAPRIYDWKTAPDKSATGISAVAADRIEPHSSLPAI